MMNSFLMSLCPSRAAGSCCNHQTFEREAWLFPDMKIFSIVSLHISNTHDVWIPPFLNMTVVQCRFHGPKKFSRVPGHLQ